MADEQLFEGGVDDEETGGRFSREELIRRAAAVGLAAPSLSFLIGAGQAAAAGRPLTPTFYQWIFNNYPDIPGKVNKAYSTKSPLDAKIAPVQGFGIERFLAEAK